LTVKVRFIRTMHYGINPVPTFSRISNDQFILRYNSFPIIGGKGLPIGVIATSSDGKMSPFWLAANSIKFQALSLFKQQTCSRSSWVFKALWLYKYVLNEKGIKAKNDKKNILLTSEFILLLKISIIPMFINYFLNMRIIGIGLVQFLADLYQLGF